jgi:hypothetical protein
MSGQRRTYAQRCDGGVGPVPAHLYITPRLVVRDGAAAVDFYERAFGAREIGERFVDPAGRLIHAEVQIRTRW